MFKFLASIFTNLIIGRVLGFIARFTEELRNERILKDKLKEIQSEKDAVIRAKRMRDFLS